jgi:endonuclease/exonuclease/phosphatase family metal-dependent hydrolase
MASELKIMCWNINEGRGAGPGGDVDATLEAIAKAIKLKSPDIVLLNEVRKPFGVRIVDRHNQAKFIANRAGIKHHEFGGVNLTGLGVTGLRVVGLRVPDILVAGSWKGMAILSRWPPLRMTPKGKNYRVERVIHEGRETNFGTMVATFMINGKRHHVLSTRLAPHNDDGNNRAENPSGIQHALELVNRIPPDEPIIFGGDFNASTDEGTRDPTTGKSSVNEYEPDMVKFFNQSGLKEVLNKAGGYPVGKDRVDYIFYRGAYEVVDSRFENFDMNTGEVVVGDPPSGERLVSDHPWIFAVLKST